MIMDDKIDIEGIEKDIINKNAVEDRIRNLHKDKKLAEEAAEAAKKAKEESEAKLAALEKETTFLNKFSDINAKFPGANDFKDKIKEKFASGYSVEDATVSILHAEGKLNPQTAPVVRDNVAGGSAPNQITNQAQKTLAQMSRDERWAALAEAERRGDIGLS